MSETLKMRDEFLLTSLPCNRLAKIILEMLQKVGGLKDIEKVIKLY